MDSQNNTKKKTIIVWFRSDLRIHDHPALSKAIADAQLVIPLFIHDEAITNGKNASSNRNRFLLECLEDLRASFKTIGGDLIIRSGKPLDELLKIIDEFNVNAVYYTADFSPFALKRDAEIEKSLQAHAIEVRGFSGKLIVSTLSHIRTKAGKIHKIFTPFYKNWQLIERRKIAATPTHLQIPQSITPGFLPKLESLTETRELSPHVSKGGETAARKRLHDFLDGPIHSYHNNNNDTASNMTSRLSPYFHFGCLSAREIESMLSDDDGSVAWRRQLAWRDFYHYILFYFPHPEHEFQEKFRDLAWGNNSHDLEAWKEGKTGYPIVDAAMRQLKQEGWMHNRARLIVGSFLTKDLWIDWRLGEQHFMKWLLDGDMANNNGNWQWIASVGVDPAPLFRRLYNPSSQQKNYDPTGAYVRKYVPELNDVPDKYLAEPWNMPREIQDKSGCIIGKDYPSPMIDHKEARLRTIEAFAAIKNNPA